MIDWLIDKLQVLNISKVKFPDIAVYPSLTRDRAKWAVTKKLGRWICVGDHDRSVSNRFHIQENCISPLNI